MVEDECERKCLCRPSEFEPCVAISGSERPARQNHGPGEVRVCAGEPDQVPDGEAEAAGGRSLGPD